MHLSGFTGSLVITMVTNCNVFIDWSIGTRASSYYTCYFMKVSIDLAVLMLFVLNKNKNKPFMELHVYTCTHFIRDFLSHFFSFQLNCLVVTVWSINCLPIVQIIIYCIGQYDSISLYNVHHQFILQDSWINCYGEGGTEDHCICCVYVLVCLLFWVISVSGIYSLLIWKTIARYAFLRNETRLLLGV